MHRRGSKLFRSMQYATLLALASCEPGGQSPAAGGDSAAPLLPAATPASACGAGGSLSARLYGALDGELDWQGAELSCEGMPRPEGQGARLRFSGSPGKDVATLVVIVAIPGLARGETGAELPSNVTLIEEGVGRFFSTPDLDQCWTDVRRQEPAQSEAEVYRIEGAVYCIAPVAEVNGDASVTIQRLEFAGTIDWSAS